MTEQSFPRFTSLPEKAGKVDGYDVSYDISLKYVS